MGMMPGGAALRGVPLSGASSVALWGFKASGMVSWDLRGFDTQGLKGSGL